MSTLQTFLDQVEAMLKHNWLTLDQDEVTVDLAKLLAVCRLQREALEQVKSKVGFCIFGSTDTSGDSEVAFRQGSYQAFCDTGVIASEALAASDKLIGGE